MAGNVQDIYELNDKNFHHIHVLLVIIATCPIGEDRSGCWKRYQNLYKWLWPFAPTQSEDGKETGTEMAPIHFHTHKRSQLENTDHSSH